MSEFRNALQQLAFRADCSTFDPDLWETAFTHGSFQNQLYPTERFTESLLEIVDRVGDEALRTSIYEYALDVRGLDPAETSRRVQLSDHLLAALLTEFRLVDIQRIGERLRTNESIHLELAGRFIGLVTISSSYSNSRNLIWKLIDSTLFSSPGSQPDYRIDPKSQLQEHCHRLYGNRSPQYQLISEIGPDHNKTFFCRVVLPDRRATEGSGPSLKAAQKQAAVKMLARLQPLARRPSAKQQEAATAQGLFLNTDAIEVDKYLLAMAPVLAGKLRCQGFDVRQLALALTVPTSIRGSNETNLRHKMLGAALEALALVLFAFQSIPIRAFGSSNISQFLGVISSNSQHAILFDRLELQGVVCHNLAYRLSEQRKADVIKAIGAAIYLSTRDFSQFFRWITDNLGTWCQERVALLAENPLEVKEPKSFFDILLGAQRVYKAEYVDAKEGPDHLPTFSTELFLTAPGVHELVGHGIGSGLKEAQQQASANALEILVPRNVAGRLRPIAAQFWRGYLDPLLQGEPGVVVAACGVEHFKNLNSFSGFFGLKAFSRCVPDISCYLEHPDIAGILVRSIGRLTVASPRTVLSLANKGIALVAGAAPDALESFTAPQVDIWLSDLRRASAGLKLPTRELRSPLALVPLSELCHVRDWKLSLPAADPSLSIPEPMFSHIVTFLELLGRDLLTEHNNAEAIFHAATDWRSVRLVFRTAHWSRLHLEEVVNELLANAFFSGVSDAVRESSSSLSVEFKGVCFDIDEPHVAAYIEILQSLFQGQAYIRTLYRIVHDLKNQVLALRNYALRAMADPQSKYKMFAAIEQVQEQIRGRDTALQMFFKAADQSTFGTVHLQRMMRDFIGKLAQTLPENIRLDVSDKCDAGEVAASKELLLSLLDNLTQNAIDAMPHGGRLSIQAAFDAEDPMLEISVSDTGVGILPEMLPELFVSLKSTKAKGMGLGLATVRQIVEQHGGLVEVVSSGEKGTTFTILLPLRREGSV